MFSALFTAVSVLFAMLGMSVCMPNMFVQFPTSSGSSGAHLVVSIGESGDFLFFRCESK